MERSDPVVPLTSAVWPATISPKRSNCAMSSCVACREVLLQVGTRQSSSLVAAIDALLDLDDEASPGSQR